MDDYISTRRKGPSARPVLVAVLASFLLGGAIVGYAVYSMTDLDAPETASTAQDPQLLVSPTADPTPTPSATASEAAQQAVKRVEQQQGGIDQRLAAAEQRLARLDLQAQAAAGNAARAEGLLIAFATRRALEKGAELGYLADQLRLRFGDALPNAVDTIIRTSRDPITLDQLIARLEGLSPRLAQPNDQRGWARFGEELSQLFVIRRESAPSPQPERRLERARLFLESGRTQSAIAEVRNLPGADEAEGWIRDAERYAAAQRALDLIETAAVLEPRRLRDGAGNRIEQPSPAEEN
ncbi:MICOS complex subunit MIC60 [Erythrobacter sp. SN021]|uniref:MICOS complex subunit MIC60 n=1 Tax=Erythrobacter sp. SN021 TaxID=2912574 RepID=UPI001F397746|nr:MICOS complex subunit MIC60 [Erythrobacter sp. SN021]MCF8881938.1 MICOS complex subunit MIC60 [Erythrobacter sp. SN021]